MYVHFRIRRDKRVAQYEALFLFCWLSARTWAGTSLPVEKLRVTGVELVERVHVSIVPGLHADICGWRSSVFH